MPLRAVIELAVWPALFLTAFAVFIRFLPPSRLMTVAPPEGASVAGFALEDDTFFERFYDDTDTPRDIPIRLRKLLATRVDKLLWKVHPKDEFAHVNDELDLGDVFDWISSEFKVPYDASDWSGRDSFKFDWFVQWLQRKGVHEDTV